jgi:hypothetical protein
MVEMIQPVMCYDDNYVFKMKRGDLNLRVSRPKSLIFSVKPFGDESFIGYMLRLTELNHYETLSLIFQLTNIKDFTHSRFSLTDNSMIDLTLLAQLTRVNKSNLEALLYKPVQISQNRMMGLYSVFGQPVPHYAIRLRTPKVCTTCLQESSYARKIWDLALVTTCPFHQCLLLDECPNCRQRISWFRDGISLCQCKFDWRQHNMPTINDSALEVTRQIHRICRLPDTYINEEICDLTVNPLYKLDLGALLSALLFVAGQYKGMMDTQGRRLATSLRNGEIHHLLSKAWAVFSNWPGSYFSFLDWRRSQAPEISSTHGLHKDFAKYRSVLYRELSLGQLKFLKDGFEEYVTTQWDGGHISRLKRFSEPIRQNSKYTSKLEAKKLLNIGFCGIDNLIAAGILRAIVQKQDSSRLVLIERSSLLEFKAELDHSMYLKKVEELLGISGERVIELIDYGLLHPIRGPKIDGCKNWKFRETDVRSLLDDVSKRMTEMVDSLESHTISFLIALRSLRQVNVRAGQFVKAILEGKISPCGSGKKKVGLAGLLFFKGHIARYAKEEQREQKGEILDVLELSKYLGVSREAVYSLIGKGLIQSLERSREGCSGPLVTREALYQFNSIYIMSAKVARKLGTSSAYLAKLLKAHGVSPVSGRRIDGGCLTIFRKSDVDTIDVIKLINDSKITATPRNTRQLQQRV